MTPIKLHNQITFQMQQANQAYLLYMASGQTYRHAKQIKEANDLLRGLLNQHASLIPSHLVSDCNALMEHLNIWSGLWEELQATANPDDDDRFVFENDHSFPTEAAQRIQSNWQTNS